MALGDSLTLYSLGTSRSKITIGKKQHFPRQFTPAGLLFQMAGRHTHYFRACAVCLHFLLGNAQVFLGGVYRVHIWLCASPLHGPPLSQWRQGRAREMALGSAA